MKPHSNSFHAKVIVVAILILALVLWVASCLPQNDPSDSPTPAPEPTLAEEYTVLPPPEVTLPRSGGVRL